MNRRTVRYNFIRRERIVRLLAGNPFEHHQDLPHAGRAADRQHLVDLIPRLARSLNDPVQSMLSAVQQTDGELVELFEGKLDGQRIAVMSEGEPGMVPLRQVHLRLFSSLQQVLVADRIIARVGGELILEHAGGVVDDDIVPVTAAEPDVAIGRQYSEPVAIDAQ